MYKHELERYDGDLDAIVKDVVEYAIKEASEITSLDGNPINVLFSLSISEDQDCDPKDAYFWTVDEVQTQTCLLALGDTADAIVAKLKAGLELAHVMVGNLISFSFTTWKGNLQ